MRDKPGTTLEKGRIRSGKLRSQTSFGNNGAFFVTPPGGIELKVIASDGDGWDHVSVSLETRCPTWDEMCHVKGLFFREDEWVMQFHPPVKDNINVHPNCLHLWRPHKRTIPTPPRYMVG